MAAQAAPGDRVVVRRIDEGNYERNALILGLVRGARSSVDAQNNGAAAAPINNRTGPRADVLKVVNTTVATVTAAVEAAASISEYLIALWLFEWAFSYVGDPLAEALTTGQRVKCVMPRDHESRPGTAFTALGLCVIRRDFVKILESFLIIVIPIFLALIYTLWRNTHFFACATRSVLARKLGIKKVKLSSRGMVALLAQVMGFAGMVFVQHYHDTWFYELSNYANDPKTGESVGTVHYHKSVQALLMWPLAEEIVLRSITFHLLYNRISNVVTCVFGTNIFFSVIHVLSLQHEHYHTMYIVSHVIQSFAMGLLCTTRLAITDRIWDGFFIHSLHNFSTSFLDNETATDLSNPIVLGPMVQFTVTFGLLAWVDLRKIMRDRRLNAAEAVEGGEATGPDVVVDGLDGDGGVGVGGGVAVGGSARRGAHGHAHSTSTGGGGGGSGGHGHAHSGGGGHGHAHGPGGSHGHAHDGGREHAA